MKCKLFWQNSILILLSCSIGLLAGEFVVATFFPQNLGTWGMTRDGLTTHVPNVSVYMSKFRQQVTINSQGMRDREHSISKPGGTFRILLLGDSFMEANQIDFNEALPHLLEEDFGQPVEVINASVSGWGTDQQMTYLMRYGYRFEPDLVLVGMTLHNDLQDNLAEEFHSLVNGVLHEKPKAEIPPGDFALLQVKEFLASHSHLHQLYLKAKRFSFNQEQGNRLSLHVAALIKKEPVPDIVKAWDMTRELFKRMKVESERRGAKVAVFLIPLWIQVSEERLGAFLNEHQLSINQLAIEQPQLHMRAIGQEEKIEIIDLLPDFRRAEKEHPHNLYLADDGHWTAAGHRLAAGIVRKRLRDLGVPAVH